LLRAFIQWGGFTFGKTASFYDFFNTSRYSHQTNFMYQDYAGVGVFTYGYTQPLGNGVAANIALQDPTNFEHPIVDVSNTTAAGAAAATPQTFVADSPFTVAATGPTNSGFTNAGFVVPDIVGSLRVDQAWAGAQVAAILHDNRATAFLNPGNGIIDTTAHPSDRWGYGISGGLELNLQNWGWAKGDTFAVQSQYCVGDSESCINNSGSRLADLFWARKSGGKIGLAWVDDAYFANNTAGGVQTGLQLPKVWNVWAAVQHYWTPELRTSLYGGFAQYKASSSAVDASVCAPLHAGRTLFGAAGASGTITGSSAVSASGCADWATWAIGSRTVWNPVRNLDVGVDVLYSTLTKSAFEGATLVFTPAQAPAERLTAGSSNIVAGIVRVQYNFYP
jgi:hypothetical protein